MTWHGKKLDYLAEEHHTIYGREWCLGLDHFEFIRDTFGEELSGASLLDLGCGSLRTGIHLIPNVKSYLGIDGHKPSVEAALNYEIPMHRLEGFAPRVICDEKFTPPDEKFDIIFAFSVFIHLDARDTARALDLVRQCSHEGTRIVINKAVPDAMSEGFEVVKEEKRRCRWLDSSIKWIVLQPRHGG